MYLGTVVQSVALVLVAPVAGRLSDRLGRRKVFVMVAAVIYASALFVIAGADSFDGYLVGMAIGGVGFGMYMAVDLALVVDVLSDPLDRGQGPWRPQHRRRPAVCSRARRGTRTPGARGR